MRLKPEKRRWLIVFVIFLAIVFNYFDRQIVSVLKPILKEEFELDDSGYAVLINVFTIFYALMYPVSGWLVDKFGAKIVMFSGVVGWSLASIGSGLSATFGQFTFFRALLGASEPTNFPAQLKVVATWFSGKMRATANSLSVAGSSIGAIMAPPLIAWLTLSFKWEEVFIVAGVAGLIIATLWLLVYRNPPESITKEIAQTDKVSDTTHAFTWKQLWGRRSLWGILLIRFVTDPVWYFCLFWLPGFLQEKSGFSLIQIGLFGWIPFLAADLGAIGTAAWSDSLVRKGMNPLRARKIMLSCTAILAPLCIVTTYFQNPFLTIAIFSVIGIIALSWLFTISVVIAEAFPVKNVASVLGIAGGFGAVGAVLFNYFVGQFMDTLGPARIFFVMAFLHPIAVLILWTVVKKENPPEPILKPVNN